MSEQNPHQNQEPSETNAESDESATSKSHDDIFEQYWRHADAMRNWFVAYGIGGVLLFVTNRDLFDGISKIALKIVVFSFLTGVLLQVLLTFINKGHNYDAWLVETGRTTSNKNAWSANTWFRIDKALDVLTLISFLIATVVLVTQI